jgi:Carboxypeptidase regulatory-like domain
MRKRKRIASVGVVLMLVLPILAREKKPAPPASVLTFLILKDYNGKPLRNAAVVLHPVNGKDKQQNGGLELKTDADGKASYDGIPYGRLRVQVLAPGFQTFGEDYDINQPTMDVTIKMKRPAGQYSIYEEHPAEKKDAAPDEQPKPQ